MNRSCELISRSFTLISRSFSLISRSLLTLATKQHAYDWHALQLADVRARITTMFQYNLALHVAVCLALALGLAKGPQRWIERISVSVGLLRILWLVVSLVARHAFSKVVSVSAWYRKMY